MAIHRRPAARRGAASADAARGRHLRGSAAGAEWRTDSSGRAVEVWVQGREVAGPDSLRGQAAAQHVAEDEPERIRVLRQRESSSRSPALESGAREAVAELHRQPAQDRKSTRLNSSHSQISYAVFCLKKK